MTGESGLDSPRRHTLDEIEEREARNRDRFAHLALIAPSPEMVRAVMALEADGSSVRTAVIVIDPERESVAADR